MRLQLPRPSIKGLPFLLSVRVGIIPLVPDGIGLLTLLMMKPWASSEANRGWARERLFIDRTVVQYYVNYGARLRGQGASLWTISVHPSCSSLACQGQLPVGCQTGRHTEAPPQKVSARSSRSCAKLQSGVAWSWSIANRKTPQSANAVRAAQKRPEAVAASWAWRLTRVAPALPARGTFPRAR